MPNAPGTWPAPNAVWSRRSMTTCPACTRRWNSATIECALSWQLVQDRRTLGVDPFHPPVVGRERRGALEHAMHECLAREPLCKVRVPLTLLAKRRGGCLAHSRTAHRPCPMARINRQRIVIGLQTLDALVELTGKLGALFVAQQIRAADGVHEQEVTAEHGGRFGRIALEDQKTEVLRRVTGRVNRLEVDVTHRHSLAVRDVPMRMALPQRFPHGRELTPGASRRSAPPARWRPRRSLREYASRGRRRYERRVGETSRGKRQYLVGGLRRRPRRRRGSRRCRNTEPIPRLQSVPAATQVLTLATDSAAFKGERHGVRGRFPPFDGCCG